MADDPLFAPLKIGSMSLKNRVVMAPMTRMFAPGGVLDDAVPAYYARRASGGTGLIITEGTAVDHAVAHYSDRIPRFYGEAPMARWRAVVEAVHAEGGRIIPQLWHTGLSRLRGKSPNPDEASISASAISEHELVPAQATDIASPAVSANAGAGVPARAMTLDDIDAVIAAFAGGAVAAKAAGFDGVAIHGAHGYLLDQFMWTRSNRRDDGYGGDVAGRVRFAAEIVSAVRAAVGPDFPLVFRFSQWKSYDYGARIAETPDDLAAILQPLAEAGVDVFDASTRRFWKPEFAGSDLNLAGWARKLTGRLAMTVGSVGLEDPVNFMPGAPPSQIATANLDVLRRMMDKGEVDLAGVGRALIANPDWADLVARGRYDALRPYDAAAIATTLEPLTADA